ncbi:MAG: hypothetical protein AAB225_04095 [Acidobacteriota bacterium]
MKIAILGWGSLIWDPRDLPREGCWQTGGPVLPVEFSRVSSDGRLTLVIDPTDGAEVRTLFVRSARSDLDDAICDLRCREGTSCSRIGCVDLVHTWTRSRGKSIAEIVQKWMQSPGFDAVVWTDLAPNFKDKTGKPFSVEAAIQYLEGLPKGQRRRAYEYVNNAPPEVDTPVRRRLRESGKLAAWESGNSL